jgi:predicted secreted protein
MAFRPAKKQPEFASLKGILAQTKKQTESPLYQTVEQIIERLTQFQMVTLEQVADISESTSENETTIINVTDKNATYLTKEDETAKFPFSVQLLAGLNITFDDTVPNKRTINSTGGGGYAPMSTGAEPLEIMSDGAGSVLMVGFNE